jgi:hypothetical protein
MIAFLDGPAIGHPLELHRVPLYLRVTITAAGEVDALDQLDDVPRDNESLHAYVLSGTPTRVHLCRRPRSRSGWYHIAAYKLADEQPSDAVMRDTAAWQAWAIQQAERRDVE